jgi:hypothetical protein
LSDIRPLLNGWDDGDLSDEAILAIAENRYLALEKQVTERLVLQHELELFLQDLNNRKQTDAPETAFDKLLERVCADPTTKSSAHFMLNWLMEQAGCNLTTESGRRILEKLQGQHVHVKRIAKHIPIRLRSSIIMKKDIFSLQKGMLHLFLQDCFWCWGLRIVSDKKT